jgi:hypothetical protein
MLDCRNWEMIAPDDSDPRELRKEQTMASPMTDSRADFAISQLQGDAWAAWNASFHAEEKDAYRTVGRALYAQDVHERITNLFARSDAQNAFLDMMLATAAKS